MGNDNFHSKFNRERTKRRNNIEIQKPSRWLLVCEGAKTEVVKGKILLL